MSALRSLAHALVYLVLTIALAGGCAPGTMGVRQAYGNVAVLNAAGYKALHVADVIKQDAVRAEIAADPLKATSDLHDWQKARAIVRKVLDGAQDTIEIAAQMCDDIDAGRINLTQPLAAWIASLLELAPKIVAALLDVGVVLPASVTSLGGAK